MSTSIPSNADSHASFSWPRRLAIAACLIVGCVFSLRAMTPDVAAKVTSETSQLTKLQTAEILSTANDADVKLVTKNIENIQAGDLVLARHEHGSAIGLKPVKETYQRVSHHLRHLTFETPDGKQQTLSTTDEHPFWSVTAAEFVEAGSLIAGHSVAGSNGETQTLVSSAREEFPVGVPVFNFQVTDHHTYFVAASADKPVMLVHNAEYGLDDAAERLGVNLDRVYLDGDVAIVEIDLAKKLQNSDMAKVRDHLKNLGAKSAQVETGVISNPQLRDFLESRAADGRTFFGGAVQPSDWFMSDFRIMFSL